MTITGSEQLWPAIRDSMPNDTWVPLQDVYALVRESVRLTREDQEPEAPGSAQLKWKHNVRNVLQRRKLAGDIQWDGHARYMIAGGRAGDALPTDARPEAHIDSLVKEELLHRLALWRRVLEIEGAPAEVPASLLTSLRVHVGEQGIFRDQRRTGRLTASGTGVTVGVLHTGRRYADDLADDGVIYHYPDTKRPRAHDKGEVDATKAAGQLGLPVFVMTPCPSDAAARAVHLAWVEGWDDDSRLFLLVFGEERPSRLLVGISEEEPFELTAADDARAVTAPARRGQQRFKFRVLQRYGAQCAVCGVGVLDLLDAVHIRPKREHGSDDPRNGLILCASHHRAFDAGLLAIHPEALTIHCREGGPGSSALMIGYSSIEHLPIMPHESALSWRWERWRSA